VLQARKFKRRVHDERRDITVLRLPRRTVAADPFFGSHRRAEYGVSIAAAGLALWVPSHLGAAGALGWCALGGCEVPIFVGILVKGGAR